MQRRCRDYFVVLFDASISSRATRASSGESPWIFTRAVPAWTRPITFAAAYDRSRIRPRENGPRSLIFTTTDLPFAWFVTRTYDASGSVRCAAVNSFMLKRSPFAVRRP
ncbi:hypothetical protein Y026_4783 [Burkholderia pseudomallei TSV28]|nr:hypothetical protein Y026_4783 [Burkholderia pseudomallei TSV28]